MRPLASPLSNRESSTPPTTYSQMRLHLSSFITSFSKVMLFAYAENSNKELEVKVNMYC